ncbi:MAG TPA: tetratricopeptide repeat protein [Terriglobales bacterium]|nr:tetratricopeptide repeat protein [Terriglobales bacterium]
MRWTAFLVLLCAVAFGSDANLRHVKPAQKSVTLPVTTTSAAARKEFEHAMGDLEKLRRADAIEDLRAAVKHDPKFAQAYILVSQLTHDPDEQVSARSHAEQLAGRVTPGERLLIRWISGVQENNYVPAIAAMNDLLAMYPQDHRTAFLAGRWLVHQRRYAQGIFVLEHALTLFPEYPAALNELAYAYAFSGNFEKAYGLMDRYVQLQPDQPNPYDSYGEILRAAGHYAAALEKYRQAIQVDPNFGSELGVADTLAVMGREAEAREEYAKALIFVTSDSDRVEYELQAAVTWIREGNHKQVDRSMHDIARNAHAAGLAKLEAEANRIMAMSAPDYHDAAHHLKAAEHALDEGHPISRSDQEEERALILEVAARSAAHNQAMDAAEKSVAQLETMAGQSRSQVIQLAYHAAAGSVLAEQGKYAEAIPHLEEDMENPESMLLLWKAYKQTGAQEDANLLAKRLAGMNEPTVEQALVVPQFRAVLADEQRQAAQ